MHLVDFTVSIFLVRLRSIPGRKDGHEHPDALTVRGNLAHWTGRARDVAPGERPVRRPCCPSANESPALIRPPWFRHRGLAISVEELADSRVCPVRLKSSCEEAQTRVCPSRVGSPCQDGHSRSHVGRVLNFAELHVILGGRVARGNFTPGLPQIPA